jgi:hypothetical protein
LKFSPRERSSEHEFAQTSNLLFTWWGEAPDEPALTRQSEATTAREDARPPIQIDCVVASFIFGVLFPVNGFN